MSRCRSLSTEGFGCPARATVAIRLHYPCGCHQDWTANACDKHAGDPVGYCHFCKTRLVKSEPIPLSKVAP